MTESETTYWQGNPELVAHRKKLVNFSFWRASLEDRSQDIVYDTEKASVEVFRADGRAICRLCGLSFRDHPNYPWIIDTDNRPSEIELCNGEIVHL
jgi:hypothetical protein